MSKKSNKILRPRQYFVLVNVIMALDLAANILLGYISTTNSMAIESVFGLIGLVILTLSVVGLTASVYTMVKGSVSIRRKVLLVLYALIFIYLTLGGAFMIMVSGIGFIG